MDQAHDPHHHPHPEILHHQRLPAALHDLPAGAEPVHAAVRTGLHPVHHAGLLR